MKAAELTSSPCVPSWAERFPRLFEIYTASDQTSPANWFQQPNVWRGLRDKSTGLQPIEDDLQVLDPASWAVFRVKSARLVPLMGEWGYFRQFFDCFNEIKGFRYLMKGGYQEVQFVPEQQDTKTPDLRARSEQSSILLEVKTINESTKQKNYFEIPGEQRIALDSENRLPGALRNKLTDAIVRARPQLFAMPECSVMRRIVYVVVRLDFNVHAEKELAAFLEGESTPEVEVVHCLLS